MKMRIMFFMIMIFAVFLIVVERTCYRHVEDIQVDWHRVWQNHQNKQVNNPNPIPFSIEYSQTNLPELFRKLDDFIARPVDLEAIASMKDDYSMGIPQYRVREWVEHWRFKYNWKERAARLNALGPQFLVTINGLQIHYFDIRSTNQSAIPLLLLHGWPGCFIEFTDVIPLLKDRFHLIVPSLPGFGFSQSPSHARDEFTFLDSAVIFAKLMKKVHPSHPYMCQGGDYGSFVCSAMAQIDTKRVLGVHLNMAVIAFPPWRVGGMASWALIQLFPFLLSSENKERMNPSVPGVLLRMVQETGYFHVQATKPETIGLALDDSPVFLLAWIGEKFRSWAGKDDFELITTEEILDNVMIYWQSKSSTTAARWYYHMARSSNGAITSILAPIPVRTALLDAPFEIFRPPSFWLKDHKYPKLEQFTVAPRGGHFFPLEMPEFLADDVKRFADTLMSRP